jgi:pyruvate-formate lyase-activating enzyme
MKRTKEQWKSKWADEEIQYGLADHQYQSIILFLNRRCTVGCTSCNVKALPGNSGELSSGWLFAFLNRLDDLRFPGYLLWTGGEPFLSYAALQTGVSIATAKGYHSEILTAGAWFRAHPEWLETFAGNRNLSLRISVDAYHQEKVPISRVIALICRAWELGLEINLTLREIPGQQQPVNCYVEEIKKQLPEFYRDNRQRSRWIHYLPHIPVSSGEGSSSAAGIKIPVKQKYKQPCGRVFRDLVLGEDGWVYPCCGFFGLPFHRRLAVANLLDESWESLAYRQSGHPLFKMLKEKGPYGICQELDLEPEEWGWPILQTPCHLCLALFTRAGEQVLDHFTTPPPLSPI